MLPGPPRSAVCFSGCAAGRGRAQRFGGLGMLKENDLTLPVSYTGTEAPPDTFKDDSQALADGSFGRDGVFHAKQLQAKCASKYAPQPGATPAAEPGKSMSQADRKS